MINWQTIIKNILIRNKYAINWPLLERWLQVELFTYLYKNSNKLNIEIFPFEPSFKTSYAKKSSSCYNGINKLFTKYPDLVFFDTSLQKWYWVELKVKNMNRNLNFSKTEIKARNNYIDDVLSFIGFNMAENYSEFYNFQEELGLTSMEIEYLKTYFSFLKTGDHFFISIFLNLDNNFHEDIWGKQVLANRIFNNFLKLKNQNFHDVDFPNISIKLSNDFFDKNSILITEWEKNFSKLQESINS